MASDTGKNPFSASEEAFFQSIPPPDLDLPSVRPVTLEEEPFATERARRPEVEARRVRLMRPVAMTLAALGVFTLMGLTRRALTDVPQELALAHAPTPLTWTASEPGALAIASEPTSVVSVPRQIIVEAETEDPPALFMSPSESTTAGDATTNSSLPAASLPEAATSSLGDADEQHAVNPPVQAASARPSGAHAKSTRARPVRHGSSATWPATVTKAGLLSAIRSSRPAHTDARKTL